MQESKYVFVFSDLISAENKSANRNVGKVFLIIKIGPVTRFYPGNAHV
jgi:hypothetical protein